ncbi:hypothetical protein HZH66_008905 [Vespula vulgaris]|uniref:Uncharacterized protein n=1 Tax=Vespula vulgaris TaxID=7454 RepID=A0A834JT75_VESVU|nr:hypothetical protein HZH66_008905 [Vespula vulgaris]
MKEQQVEERMSHAIEEDTKENKEGEPCLTWASSGRGTDSPLNSDLALDKPRPIPSPRQIHPLYGEKAGLLGYCDTVGNTENFPPAPNIVVEGGRIEFVRPSQDGTTISRRNTMSRGSQTFNDQSEKSDPAKIRRSN